jgi:hypothetical protein
MADVSYRFAGIPYGIVASVEDVTDPGVEVTTVTGLIGGYGDATLPVGDYIAIYSNLGEHFRVGGDLAPSAQTDVDFARSGTGGSGTSSASGGVVTSEVPAGLEFAFWGYVSDHPSQQTVAFRVLEAGDYSWGDEGDTDLSEGFDYNITAGDADLSDMQVGEYVVLNWSPNQETETYAARVARIGFDLQAILPGAAKYVAPDARRVDYANNVSGLTATQVQDALDELTARIVALETP